MSEPTSPSRDDDELAQLRRIRELCIKALVRATGYSRDTIEDAPLTSAIRHAEEVERLRARVSSESTFTRDGVIEEVAKHIEASPLTYAGPDPGAVRDLKFLIVAAIRDMKGA